MILEVRDLHKTFTRRGGRTAYALAGVSLGVAEGEVLGVVGESGSGKSTLARVLLRLEKPDSGAVLFDGTDLHGASRKSVRLMRRDLQMVFQDPQSSLNPRQTVRTILTKPFRIQGIRPAGGLDAELAALMADVGLEASHLDRYPHQFSGGQRQRIAIARALALKPRLIVCDEPVSAIDVSVQAQVLNLLARLRRERGMGYVFIAHDLAVVRHISDRVAVMYRGRVVESASRDQLYDKPRHPYTRLLLDSVPVSDPLLRPSRTRQAAPVVAGGAGGCAFRNRCKLYASLDASARGRCESEVPELRDLGEGTSAACHHA